MYLQMVFNLKTKTKNDEQFSAIRYCSDCQQSGRLMLMIGICWGQQAGVLNESQTDQNGLTEKGVQGECKETKFI